MAENKKDPACLFYIDTWLSATAEMDSDVRGWYLNLILHQYDKKDLPNDLEKLAVLAGVKFSEFERFKQMFEQVLKHKFELNDNQRLENGYAKSILSSREQFKDKRQKSGNIGVVIKMAKTIKGFDDEYVDLLKKHLYTLELSEIDKHKDKQVLEQMLEQMLKLYINENKNINNNSIEERKQKFADSLKPYLSIYGKDMLNDFYGYWTEHGEKDKKFRAEKQTSFNIERRLDTWKKNDAKFKPQKTDRL